MSGKKAQSPVRKCNWQLHSWDFPRAGRVARRITAEQINHTCNLFQDLVSRVTAQVATSGVDDRLMCVSNRDDGTLSAYVKLDVLFLSLFFPLNSCPPLLWDLLIFWFAVVCTKSSSPHSTPSESLPHFILRLSFQWVSKINPFQPSSLTLRSFPGNLLRLTARHG